MKFTGIIPTCYGSFRFPGRPLAILGGKTVIQRAYEQVSQVLEDAFVATDGQRIFDAAAAFGGKAMMTGANHRSGTDRTEEAVEQLELTCDVVFSIQGDEPFTQRQQIETLCHCFDNSRTQITTLGKRFESQKVLGNPDSPKIVADKDGYALYFSRSAIPFTRNKEGDEWMGQYPFLKHLGTCAYRREILKGITHLPQSPLELAESLEQLRWLQNSYHIKAGLTDIETVGIGMPEDLERAERFSGHFQQVR